MARRKFHIAKASSPNSDINVTPLVDVVLVLLIIFMVVTPLLEKDIEVRVPDIEQQDNPDQPPPDDQLVVQLDVKGQISINTHPVSGLEYVPELAKLLKYKHKDEKIVFFLADDKTNYGAMVQALDGAMQAGAEVLGMMTEPIDNAGGGQAPAPAPSPEPGK